MPRAEEHQEPTPDAVVLENDDLESGQRYGLMEDERSISGQKRICYTYGFLQGKFKRHCLIPFFTSLILVVYILGFYSGYASNCLCNTTLT